MFEVFLSESPGFQVQEKKQPKTEQLPERGKINIPSFLAF